MLAMLSFFFSVEIEGTFNVVRYFRDTLNDQLSKLNLLHVIVHPKADETT